MDCYAVYNGGVCELLNIYAFSNICFTVSFQKNTFRNVNFQEEYIHSRQNINQLYFYAFIFLSYMVVEKTGFQ